MRNAFNRSLWIAAIAALLFGCGGGEDESGTLTINIGDAKPLLGLDAIQVLVTFDEVRVHKAGGGWLLLPLARSPYTLDLLPFADGGSTELVPPVELDTGKYTQLRLGVTEASLVTAQGEEPLQIPSGNLKTTKNFEFAVASGKAVDLMVDFDLSRSIVSTAHGYQLKPVLHLNETAKAATLLGTIDQGAFGPSALAEVTVTCEGEPYTRLEVDKEDRAETPFRVFWLLPNRQYRVEIEIEGTLLYEEVVGPEDTAPGSVFLLNGGDPISQP